MHTNIASKIIRVERSTALEATEVEALNEAVSQSGILALPEKAGEVDGGRFTLNRFYINYRGTTAIREYYYAPWAKDPGAPFSEVKSYMIKLGKKATMLREP